MLLAPLHAATLSTPVGPMPAALLLVSTTVLVFVLGLLALALILVALAVVALVKRQTGLLFKTPEEIDREYFTSEVALPQGTRPQVPSREEDDSLEPVLVQLAQRDPDFSRPGLFDLVLALHRRATLAVHDSTLDDHAVFVGPAARRTLSQSYRGVPVPDLLAVEKLKLVSLELGQHWTTATFELRTMHRTAGAWEARAERWTLRRGAQARSRSPLEMLAQVCPACGAAVDLDDEERCASCEARITLGQTHWQVHEIRVGGPEVVEPPPPRREGPPPPRRSALAEIRDFKLKHPDFEPKHFERFAKDVLSTLTDAVNDADWSRARPLVTDLALNALVARSERLQACGMRERVQDLEITRIAIAGIAEDPYYAELTAWVAGERAELRTDREGRLLMGDPGVRVPFQEHWTFRGEPAVADRPIVRLDVCPACHEPIDVDDGGVCRSCSAWVTTGHHRWVISRLHPPEGGS